MTEALRLRHIRHIVSGDGARPSPSRLPAAILRQIEDHISARLDAAATSTIAGQPAGPAEPLTAVNMAQRILDALAPRDHWRVHSDAIMPLSVPVVRMTNDRGIREHHIGASAAMLMATKSYCPSEIIDIDAGCWRRGVIDPTAI